MLPTEELLEKFVTDYGYWGVGVVVGLENMGLPLPGETILALAAIYAAHNPDMMSIWWIVGAATAGAILGDNVGYLIGRRYGYPLLLRYGRYIHMNEGRIKIGQYLFQRYGGAVVFFGRFVALLRILAAFLAGVNNMDWKKFLLANALGGIIWASFFGFGGYLFGLALQQFKGPLAIAAAVGAAIAFFGFGWFMRRHERTLLAEAEKAIPGPLPRSY